MNRSHDHLEKKAASSTPQRRCAQGPFEEIVLKKSNTYCFLLSCGLFGLAFYILTVILQHGDNLKLVFILLPFQMAFLYVGYGLLAHMGDKIIVNAEGILAEFHSKEPIAWKDIVSMSVFQEYHPTPLAYLDIHLAENRGPANSTARQKPRSGADRCQLVLTEYNVDCDAFINVLRAMHRHYRGR